MCLTVTLLDGLVLARSGFHSSMNYRSVVVLGTAHPVTGDEKGHALAVISDQILKGRWDEIRGPSRKELNGTTVLALPLKEASAKVRTGGPIDDEEDYAMPIWAGVVPLAMKAGKPIPDAAVAGFDSGTGVRQATPLARSAAIRRQKRPSLSRQRRESSPLRRPSPPVGDCPQRSCDGRLHRGPGGTA